MIIVEVTVIRVREVIGPNQDQPEKEARAGTTEIAGDMGTMTASIISGIMNPEKTKTIIAISERRERKEEKIPNNTSSIRNAGLRTKTISTIVKNMIRGSRNQEGKNSGTIALMIELMKEGTLRK